MIRRATVAVLFAAFAVSAVGCGDEAAEPANAGADMALAADSSPPNEDAGSSAALGEASAVRPDDGPSLLADGAFDLCHDDVQDGDETGVDCGGACLPCRKSPLEAGIYPQGERFGLTLLAMYPPETADNTFAASCGFNVSHAYYTPEWTADESSISPTFIQEMKAFGFGSLGSLGQVYFDSATGPLDEATLGPAIEACAAEQVAYWDLPEERRYWIDSEMAIVTSYSAWTRAHDPLQRPNVMYIPGHYPADGVAHYVPYLDVVSASCYARYYGKPNAWVRWRVEETGRAVTQAGAALGRDYLNGQKTLHAYLELYNQSVDPTPEASYHDFWQAIVSGARSLGVYSFAYKDSSPALQACWQRLCQAAKDLTGPENIEQAILQGQPDPSVRAQIVSGPTRTPSFSPLPDAPEIDLPAMDSLAVRFDGELFVIAVSSADAAITASIGGLGNATKADVLFENRQVDVSGGSLTDDFGGLGVHVYRVRALP